MLLKNGHLLLKTGRQEKTLDTPAVMLYDNTGDDMEKIVEQGILYDFYGQLLTDHQKQIYEDVVFRDLSLSEIAKEQGISRQGVHDLIKRCDRILAGYEEKLQLVHKFNETKKMVEDIHQLTKKYKETEDVRFIQRIEQIAGDIMEL